MKSAVTTRKRVLVVDDDPGVRESLAIAIGDEGWEPETAASGEAALARLEVDPPDAVVLDERMPGIKGRDVLRLIRRSCPGVAVVFLTAYGDGELLRELIDLGVDAYCDKPFKLDDLIDKLRRLLEPEVAAAVPSVAPSVEPVPGLVGRSAAMQAVYDQIRTFASCDLNVFITGETGVGKERVARAIHALSRQAGGPFVSVNCANLEPALLESELFGYVAGAFTDAKRNKRGLLVEADGGIVFLDEVVDLPSSCQAKILRAIQEREARPVGSTQAVPVNVRFIAACNEDIVQAVRQRRFREDLFHRLAVGMIHVPPLRERLEDLPELASRILARLAESTGKPVHSASRRALRKLGAYDWPGNVRELENVLARAIAHAAGPTIEAADIRLPREDDADDLRRPLAAVVQAAEREHILKVLRASQWIKWRAAETLGIARTTLNRKVEQYRLDEES